MTPQKPLRAGPAVTQNQRLDPRRVTARRWRAGEESRPPSAGSSSSAPRRLSSYSTRSPGRLGRPRRRTQRRLFSSRLISSTGTGHRPGGQSKRNGVGRVPQRDRGIESQKSVTRNAVAGSAPVRPIAPQAGPVSPIKVRSCLYSSPGVLGLVFPEFSLSGTASHRRPAAYATGETPTGRSSLPARSWPCACHASSPVADTTTAPPDSTASSGTPPR